MPEAVYTFLTAQWQLSGCRYVPLGLAVWFQKIGITNVHEMGWWQEMQHPTSSVTLACLPAQVHA